MRIKDTEVQVLTYNFLDEYRVYPVYYNYIIIQKRLLNLFGIIIEESLLRDKSIPLSFDLGSLEDIFYITSRSHCLNIKLNYVPV